MDGFISEESLEGSFFFFNIFYVSEMILKLLALGNKSNKNYKIKYLFYRIF